MTTTAHLSTSTPAPAAPGASERRWAILFVILTVEVMDLLDGTVVNVAAPAIKEALGTSLSALQWVTGGYALSFAVGLVTAGRLGDLFGRRRLFLLGVAGFTLTSAACGLAPTAGALIAGRLLQGLFAASMIPQGFGIVKQVFPPDELGKAFGLFGPVIGGSAILGPIVGGALVDADLFQAGWRMIFLVNLPLGLIALVAGAWLLPESRRSAGDGLDGLGAVLVSLASAALIFPLIQGPELDWPWWTFAVLGASGLLLTAFVGWERRRTRRAQPVLVSMALFSHRAFSAGLVCALAFFAGLIGLTFILSLYLQVGHGFSAVKTGLAFIPWAVGTAAGAGVSAGVLAPRHGRPVLHLGLGLLALGIAGLLAVNRATGETLGVAWLAGPELLCGLGMGAVISPLFNFVLAGVRDDEVGGASGVLNAVQQLGGATGVAALGTVFLSELRRAGFQQALERALLVELGLLALCALLVLLLPRRARAE